MKPAALPFAIAFAAIASPVTAQHAVPPVIESASPARGAFESQLRRHLDAIVSRDFDVLVSTLDRDVVVIFPNGSILTGKQEVADFHREWFADPEWIFEPEIIRIDSGASRASALVRYTYRDSAEAAPRSTFLSLQFRRHGDEWLLFHDQNTRIAE
jgi:ketosteroid isomerase-like protein